MKRGERCLSLSLWLSILCVSRGACTDIRRATFARLYVSVHVSVSVPVQASARLFVHASGRVPVRAPVCVHVRVCAHNACMSLRALGSQLASLMDRESVVWLMVVEEKR